MEIRKSLRWTREFLSEKSGVPPGTIQKIEDGGSKNPGIETFKLLLKPMLPPSLTKEQKEIVDGIPKIDDPLVLDTILNIMRMFFRPKKDKSAKGSL